VAARALACCIAAVCALPMAAQEPVRFAGTVLDAGTGLPIAGASVVLLHAHFTDDTASTDATGAFHFDIEKTGSYTVEASAPGYQQGRSAGPGILLEEAAFAEGAKPTVHRFTIRLKRTGAIVGRVRDRESRKPIESLSVRALRLGWMRGRRQIHEEHPVLTDSGGSFRIEALPPGEYLLEISDQRDKTASDDLPAKYALLLWPGSDPDRISPINLQGGGEFDAGAIDDSPRADSRLRLSPPHDCREGLRYHVGIDRVVGDASFGYRSVDLVCPSSVTVDSLVPGRYSLFYTAGPPLPFSGFGDAELAEGATAEVELSAVGMSSVSGRVTCDCQAPGTRRTSVAFHGDEVGFNVFMGVRFDGTFQANLPPGGMEVEVRQPPPGTYVKEVRHNGWPSGRFLTLAPGEAGTLDITLSDQPSALNVTVTRDEKPVSDHHVVAAPWPLIPDTRYPYFLSGESDAKGGFDFEDLAPGKYRVAAVSAEEWERKEAPGVIAAWFAGARDITLEEKQTARINVELK
jgi:hypothetical protein